MLIKHKLIEYMLLKKGILAANFYNYETLSGILRAAQKCETPVILQLSESSIKYLGLNIAAKMAKTALNDYGVQGWLHLDHGSSIDMVSRCLDTGFDSVMLDSSERPFADNIKFTIEAVKLAQKYEVNVEAELGFVAKLGQEQKNDGYTKPEEALKFVDETNVDTLAVSIGSMHGFYKSAPNLNIDLLAQIREIIQIPLVLHGSSGIPDKMLQDAIKNGITKVNVATETKNVFMLELQSVLKDNKEIDLRKIFPLATESVTNLICQKINVLNSAY